MRSLFGRKQNGLGNSLPPSAADTDGRNKLPVPGKDDDRTRRHVSAPSPTAFAGQSTVSLANPAEEMQILYGYWNIEYARELSTVQVSEIVEKCGKQIKQRGLDSPMLFSTTALDISMEATTSLIRTYLTNPSAWQRDIQYAHAHDLSAFIKWALGRVKLPTGGHGFLQLELYEQWRTFERQTDYSNLRFITTHLIHRLPSSTANLLTSLLSLLTSAISYTTSNGCTPHKLAALFAPFIFGLCDDQPFEQTYSAFVKITNATEHLILAWIRDQKASAGTHLPTKLESFIKGYPKDLPNNLSKPSTHSTIVQVARISRLCRFYSQDLIKSASTWDVPRSRIWDSLYPLVRPSSRLSGSTLVAQQPVFTPFYRHLLNISDENEEEADDNVRKFRSTSDKEWSSFMQSGFASTEAEKLKFDLRESERSSRRKKHETLDWSQFSSLGFGGRETFVDTDLTFDPLLAESVDRLPEEKKLMIAKLKKAEKELPDFPFDITPRESPSCLVDELFFQAWADVLVASGWAREEIKESNWVLIQWKARPLHSTATVGDGDGRTDDRWMLLEESVPPEYRLELLEGKMRRKKTLFSRSVKKRPKQIQTPTISSPLSPASPKSFNVATKQTSPRTSPVPPTFSADVFDPNYQGETRLLSLASEGQLGATPISSASPSRATSINSKRNTDHSTYSSRQYNPAHKTITEEAPPLPTFLHPQSARGLAEATISSQTPAKPAKHRFTLDGMRRKASRRMSDQSGMQSSEFRYNTSSVDSGSEHADSPQASPVLTKDDSWVGIDTQPPTPGRLLQSTDRIAPPRESIDSSAVSEEGLQPTPTFRLRSATETFDLDKPLPSDNGISETSSEPAPSISETRTESVRDNSSIAEEGSADDEIWRGSRVVPEEEFPGTSQSHALDSLPSPIAEEAEYRYGSTEPGSRLPYDRPNAEPEAVETVPSPPPKASRMLNKPKDDPVDRKSYKFTSGISDFSERSLKVSHLVNLYSQKAANKSPLANS